jgi:hypothetical protein
LFVTKFHEEQSMEALFPGQTVLGLPLSYRFAAARMQGDCNERKVQIPETDYFDSDNNLIDVFAPISVSPLDVKRSSPLDLWLDRVCPAPTSGISGIYEGTNKATYDKGGEGEQKISITVKQTGDDVSYQL